MSRSLVPLDVLASDLCSDIGDSTNRFKFKFLRKLLEAYRDMHLYVDQDFEVKTSILTYNNAINLPTDFIYETKVGVLYNGNLAVLSLDKTVRKQTLTQQASQDVLDSIWAGDYVGDYYPFYNCFRGDNFLGELYGLGRGVISNGFYNLDRKEGVIYIGSLIPEGAEIVVEYKSDGVSDGLKLVPTEMVMALKYFAKSEFYADKEPRLSVMNREYYEREYNKVKRLYNFRSALYMSAAVNEHLNQTNY